MKRLNQISDASSGQLSLDTKNAEQTSITALVTKFAALKNAIEDLEMKIAPVKATLIKIIEALPEKTVEVGEYRLVVAKMHRENFNLKAACEKLDKRILRPFITDSNYQALRITRKV